MAAINSLNPLSPHVGRSFDEGNGPENFEAKLRLELAKKKESKERLRPAGYLLEVLKEYELLKR